MFVDSMVRLLTYYQQFGCGRAITQVDIAVFDRYVCRFYGALTRIGEP
jgi:hypothetical protein